MKYDFTSIIDRHNMDAIAVDGLGTGEMSPAKHSIWRVWLEVIILFTQTSHTIWCAEP